MPHPPAYLMRTPFLILPVPSPCLALAMPFLFFLPWHQVHDGGGNDDDLCTYVVLLCVFVGVCLGPFACAQVWMVCSLWFLSFSAFLCMFCVSQGGGLAWINARMKVSLCVIVSV